MKQSIQLHDLRFRPMMDAETLSRRVQEIGREIARRYKDQRPVLLGVLNGAFVFAADLARACDIDCEVSFIKLSSYQGIQSSGNVAQLIGLEIDVKNRPVIIVEDIIDSGRTMHQFLPELRQLEPSSIAIAVLLLKPEALEFEVPIDWVGFEIPNRFVVGYGLDYNGLGRNLSDIYELDM